MVSKGSRKLEDRKKSGTNREKSCGEPSRAKPCQERQGGERRNVRRISDQSWERHVEMHEHRSLRLCPGQCHSSRA